MSPPPAPSAAYTSSLASSATTTATPSAHTLLARAWPVAEEFFSEAPGERSRETPEPETIYSINRLAPDFRAPSFPEPAGWTAPSEGREKEEIEFSWAGETARHVGSVVHRWLQRIAQDELRDWDAGRVSSLKESFARELERRGVPSGAVKASAGFVAAALSNSLADERGCWVLGPHREASSECRMRVQTSEGVRTLVMDRLFIDADGVRWIVDYKTSRHEGADVEAFLDREHERYGAQLASYAALFKDSRQGLYFPLLRGWRHKS